MACSEIFCSSKPTLVHAIHDPSAPLNQVVVLSIQQLWLLANDAHRCSFFWSQNCLLLNGKLRPHLGQWDTYMRARKTSILDFSLDKSCGTIPVPEAPGKSEYTWTLDDIKSHFLAFISVWSLLPSEHTLQSDPWSKFTVPGVVSTKSHLLKNKQVQSS